MTPQLLDFLEVAELLSITPRQATRMMNAGRLPTIRISKSELRVPADALAKWIEARTTPPTDADDLINIDQAAFLLGVPVAFLERLCDRGFVPHHRGPTIGQFPNITFDRGDIVQLCRDLAEREGDET